MTVRSMSAHAKCIGLAKGIDIYRPIFQFEFHSPIAAKDSEYKTSTNHFVDGISILCQDALENTGGAMTFCVTAPRTGKLRLLYVAKRFCLLP